MALLAFRLLIRFGGSQVSENETRSRHLPGSGATAARVTGSGRGRPPWAAATFWVTVAGVVVALAAWLLPRGADDATDLGPGTATAAAPGSTTDAPAPSRPPATATPTGTAARSVRYLTELVPSAGGGFVRRVGAHSLIMECGTGESDDRDREVSYDVPPTGYRAFGTVARPTGQRETRVQVTVLVAGGVVTAPVLTAGSGAELAAPLDGPLRLTLRLTCDAGAKSVTFVDPALTG